VPRACRCCTPQEAGEIAKAIANGASNSAVAARFGLDDSSVQRHRVRHLKAPRKAQRSGECREDSVRGGSPRFDSGRCHSCGTQLDDPNPQALIKRAEVALHQGERILETAVSSEDFNLALRALDRVRASLDQLLKVHGLLQPEGGTVVNVAVENRRKAEDLLSQLTVEELRALAYGKPLALVSSDVIDVEATLAAATDN
jgi:hypothetical protein